MIPRTFPSTVDENNRTKILVYQVPSIEGLTQWVDYIPVKSPENESDLTLANTYANEGFMLTSQINDIDGLVAFKDYIPVYLDSTANKVWSADNTSTNMTLITSSLSTASGFIRNLLDIDDYFLSSTNSGGSSTTYITDQHFANASSNRVVFVGRARDLGGRLAF